MILEQLPIEVLAQIFGHIRGLAPLHLWASGSPILRKKMENGSVTTIDLSQQVTTNSGKWPRCLSKFKLTSLQVKASSSLSYGDSDLQSELKKLHSGLRRLKIHVFDATQAFFRIAEVSPSTSMSTAPPPSKRPKQQENASSDTKHAEVWDIGATFPELEHLSVGVPYASRTPPRVHGDYLLALPRSLTSFDIGSLGQLVPVEGFSSKGPPNLKLLSLPYRCLAKNHLAHLPKMLESLHHDSLSEEAMVALLEDPQLLPNLIDFPWSGETSATSWYPMDEDCEPRLNKWPDNLRELKIAQDPEVLFDIPLGRGLTFLSFVCIPKDKYLDAVHLSQTLPSSLTDLMVDDLKWEGVAAQGWPSSLTKLRIFGIRNFATYHFHRLPRYLKSLRIEARDGEDDGDDDDEEEDEEVDEASTHSMQPLLQTGRESLLQEASLWHSIKQPILESAKTTATVDPRRASILNRYVENIESGLLLGLPLGLTTLKMEVFVAQVCSTYVLPPQIKKLDFSLPDRDYSLLDCIPTSMKAMYFTISGDGAGISMYDADFASNLKSLSNLLSLTITTNGAFDAGFAQHLPSSLTWLLVAAQSIDSTPKTLSHLPANLRDLHLYPLKLSRPIDRKLLPKSLTRLNGSDTNRSNKLLI